MRYILALLIIPVLAASAAAQATAPPSLKAGILGEHFTLDGHLDEPAWATAGVIDSLVQSDPREGSPPSRRTVVRVIAGPRAIAIGIVCDEPDPSGIVSYSVRRDAALASEDHVRVVLGPFRDGRSGYVFAVNPSGARYDGIINPGGESDNAEWDGIWDAAVTRTPTGWTAEIWIPVQTLAFKSGMREWDFNVQRRIQRTLETDRWASPGRQYQLTQTSQAGVLTDLPAFDLGLGLTMRPAATGGVGVRAPGRPADGEFEPSLDLSKRLGSNVLASATFNTDFAETEVDTRRTKLTRFPLFFPEKRTFFLEGDDIFAFGLGLNQDVLPYFSRRIGLIGDTEVPILAGGKINGRAGQTNFGGLAVATGDRGGVVENNTGMGVARIKQNVGRESWFGGIATVGDPLGRPGAWLGGLDYTYATSHFRGDKNFLVGVWGLAAGREGLGRDATASGLKIDYPNDKWDIALTYKRIGRDFDPALGFVPRPGVHIYNLSIDNSVRIDHGPLQRLFHEFEPSLVTDLHGGWESYRVFFAPINWRFRSGDRVEFNANPTGEQLRSADSVGGVRLDPGVYHWRRYRLEAGTAQKRRLYTQLTWYFGGFYDGTLDQLIWTGAWNPLPIVTVEFSGERNVADLANGSFTQTLAGSRLRLNMSSDLSLSTYIQYDTDSDSLGTNTRLRWTLRPQADLFVVYNHNLRSIADRWHRESNQLLIKLQYAWRM